MTSPSRGSRRSTLPIRSVPRPTAGGGRAGPQRPARSRAAPTRRGWPLGHRLPPPPGPPWRVRSGARRSRPPPFLLVITGTRRGVSHRQGDAEVVGAGAVEHGLDGTGHVAAPLWRRQVGPVQLELVSLQPGPVARHRMMGLTPWEVDLPTPVHPALRWETHPPSRAATTNASLATGWAYRPVANRTTRPSASAVRSRRREVSDVSSACSWRTPPICVRASTTSMPDGRPHLSTGFVSSTGHLRGQFGGLGGLAAPW